MIKFNEFLILESFEIGTKPTYNSITKAKEVFSTIVSSNTEGVSYVDAEESFDNIRKDFITFYPFIREYKNQTYLIYFCKIKSKDYFEVHFHNLQDVENNDKNNSLGTNSTALFSDIFRILYWYGIANKSKIVIMYDNSNKDTKRLSFYKSLVKKVLPKNDIQYDIQENSNNIILTPMIECTVQENTKDITLIRSNLTPLYVNNIINVFNEYNESDSGLLALVLGKIFTFLKYYETYDDSIVHYYVSINNIIYDVYGSHTDINTIDLKCIDDIDIIGFNNTMVDSIAEDIQEIVKNINN
jgi:hypothetical protein